jgi:hypothetical protein
MEIVSIRPIETHFKGYRFRSRLEARWAVFFEALGMQWAYEPEGFVLPDGTHYLPDFRITSPQGVLYWYEIKPAGITTDAKLEAFAAALAALAGQPPAYEFAAGAELLSGDPVDWLLSIKCEDGHWQGGVCPRCGVLASKFDYGTLWDSWEAYVGCWPCDVNTPSQGAAEPGLLAPTRPYKGQLVVLAQDMAAAEARVYAAAHAARAARFEHGESPQWKS